MSALSPALMGLGGDAGVVYFYVPRPGLDTPGFDSIQRDSNFQWVAQTRLSRDPAMQFTGSGEDVITIEGTLYPKFFGGLSTMETLRSLGDAGKPLTMVQFFPLEDQTAIAGRPIGRFVIKRLRETQTRIGEDGLPHKLGFSLEMSKFGEDATVVDQGLEIDKTFNTGVPSVLQGTVADLWKPDNG